MLSVREGARAVEFYKSAFGAAEVFRIESPDGAVVSRLSVDGAEFWVADESPEHENFSPASLKGSTTRMILTVQDPDAMFARALAAGAREVSAVKEDYGWRLGRVVRSSLGDRPAIGLTDRYDRRGQSCLFKRISTTYKQRPANLLTTSSGLPETKGWSNSRTSLRG
jgi:PhnB protein